MWRVLFYYLKVLQTVMGHQFAYSQMSDNNSVLSDSSLVELKRNKHPLCSCEFAQDILCEYCYGCYCQSDVICRYCIWEEGHWNVEEDGEVPNPESKQYKRAEQIPGSFQSADHSHQAQDVHGQLQVLQAFMADL